MQYVVIVVMFVMALVTAAHACSKETDKPSEVVMNYTLALLSIAFCLGFSMCLTLLLTSEAKDMHLLILLAMVPGFSGVAMNESIRSFKGFRVPLLKASSK